jgi:hypothetical protein
MTDEQVTDNGQVTSDEADKPKDERFTRADWRPGKRRRRRKRINHYGGRKVAPAAFLEAGRRVAIKPGLTNRRLCAATKRDGSKCRKIALTHSPYCGAHGGWLQWHRMGILRSTGRAEQWKRDRAAMLAPQNGPILLDLTRLSVWKEADERTRAKLTMAVGTVAWRPLLKSLLSKRHT